MKTAALLFVCVASLTGAQSFDLSSTTASSRRHHAGASSALQMSTEDERAAAMSEYLAKSHQEKLKAIQDVEQKKQAEIDALKQEMEALKQSSSSSSSSSAMVMSGGDASLENLSKEQLVNRVVQYQQYMQKYMVDAQEQKRKAVLQAQSDVNQKWGDMLMQQQQQLTPVTNTVSSTTTQSPLYQARTAVVRSAGAKSRWGPLEVHRASGASTQAPLPKASAAAAAPAAPKILPSTVATIDGAAAPPATIVNGSTAAPAPAAVVPPEVAEADHGLRADGAVGGWTLAERVSMGASVSVGAPAATATSSTTSSSAVYAARTAAVSKAGPSSRWGPLEVHRASGATSQATLPSATAAPAPPMVTVSTTSGVTPPEVLAADHGLRADGGVGGLTLAERVTQGAAASAAASAASAPLSTTGTPLYESRTAAVREAGEQSRWGPMEVARASGASTQASLPKTTAQESSTTTKIVRSSIATMSDLSGSSSSTAAVPPEVEAADHGLRADGAVGGLTLAERVAQGASSVPAGPVSVSSSSSTQVLYEQRNSLIVRAAAAGKSRWGSQEIERAQTVLEVSSASPSSAPPTLAERVNLGAALVGR